MGGSTSSSPTAAWSRMGSSLLLPLPARPMPPRPQEQEHESSSSDSQTSHFLSWLACLIGPNSGGVSRLFSTSI